MKYFDDMTNKYGFGDGGAIPPDAWACRAVYLAALNALAAHNGSAARAVPFNRPGMHNGCMILFVGAEDAARLAGGGDEEFAEVVPDKGMASAIDQANTLDLDDLVEVTARVAPGAADLVASLGSTEASAANTDGRLRSIAPRADFRGFSPAAGADQRAGCPRCGGVLGEIDVLSGYAIVSHVEAGQIVWAGDTDVDWDNQRPRHNPARFECMSCGRVFVFRASTSQFVEVGEAAWARVAGAVARWAATARGWVVGAGKALVAAPRGRET
jgi:hypothetical protein